MAYDTCSKSIWRHTRWHRNKSERSNFSAASWARLSLYSHTLTVGPADSLLRIIDFFSSLISLNAASRPSPWRPVFNTMPMGSILPQSTGTQQKQHNKCQTIANGDTHCFCQCPNQACNPSSATAKIPCCCCQWPSPVPPDAAALPTRSRGRPCSAIGIPLAFSSDCEVAAVRVWATGQVGHRLRF